MKRIRLILLTGAFLCASAHLFAGYVTEITVAQDGSGDYTTIQEAIEASKAFPDKRVTIYIKNGVYHEKLVVPACNTQLSFIGESAEKTIITYDDYFDKINRGRNSTFYTYTLKVEANDFIAENLTIENTSGPVGQAVALHVMGDRCTFHNCRILGNQDTLYTEGENSRQYYVNCTIEGTTDFIFGEATAIFEACHIRSLGNSYITAASTPKGKKFGYVFLHCKLTADSVVNNVYLGRPWRDYANVAFLYCEMGPHIAPEGWKNWDGTERYKTATYVEYGNTGKGANTSNRVDWSKTLTKKEAQKYTIAHIFKANAVAKVWLPNIPEQPQGSKVERIGLSYP